jgi:hypothetical protein
MANPLHRKPDYETVVDTLRILAERVQEDCPDRFRTELLWESLNEAFFVLEDVDEEPRYTYAARPIAYEQ